MLKLKLVLADEKQNRIDYQEAYWALRQKYNIKDGKSLEPLKDDQKKLFREEVKKLKRKFNIDQ